MTASRQHIYTVTAVVKVTAPPTGDPVLCADTGDTGIVILNTGTVTSGGYTASDGACQVVHYDDVGIVKTASGLPPQGSVEPGDSFDYVLDRDQPRRPAGDERARHG